MRPRTILAGGLLAVLLLATVGVVLTTAQDSTTTPQTSSPWQTPARNDSTPFPDRCGRMNMTDMHAFHPGRFNGAIPPGITLTAAQRDELNATIAALRQQNATPAEIRTAIQAKLDEFGVFDAQLSANINRTQLRLTILNREKELRSQGYNWTAIQDLITQEYGQNATFFHGGMTPGHDFGWDRPRGEGRPEQ